MMNLFCRIWSRSSSWTSWFQSICIQLYRQLVGRYVLPGRGTELMANVEKGTLHECHMQRRVFAREPYKPVLLFEQTSSHLELSSPRSSGCLVVHFSLR